MNACLVIIMDIEQSDENTLEQWEMLGYSVDEIIDILNLSIRRGTSGIGRNSKGKLLGPCWENQRKVLTNMSTYWL